MKKLIAVVSAVLMMTAVFSGCGNDPLSKTNVAANATTAPTEAATEEKTEEKTYEDTLSGLEQLFADKGYITVAEDRAGIQEMDASLISAEEGYRYKTNFNNAEIIIELYSYDNSDNDIVKSVKETGEFTILNLDPVKAYMSDSDKYLMIYNDKSNPAEDTDNYKRMQEVIETLKAFPAVK